MALSVSPRLPYVQEIFIDLPAEEYDSRVDVGCFAQGEEPMQLDVSVRIGPTAHGRNRDACPLGDVGEFQLLGPDHALVSRRPAFPAIAILLFHRPSVCQGILMMRYIAC